ncbi:MAG: 50S ribosomal protein L13 [Phycisphaeraceae bacterium]|nr:MAG: 50S ribosomal protein L13 [Phycisphaeraceae bacterium]
MAATHLRRQTYIAKPGDRQREWRIIDAEGISLGRLSAAVATVLMGKHLPEYTPHVDVGDFVIIINADKVGLTGNKASQKFDKRYSGHPGGQKLESYGDLRDRKPDRLIELGVRRMLPKSRLGRQMLKKMKVYAGTEHPHAGVNAVELKV